MTTTKKNNKSFFDYKEREQKKILDKAARESNRMQKELVEKVTKKDWEKELGTLLMDIYIKQKKPSCQNYPLGQLSERVGAFIRNLLDTQKKELMTWFLEIIGEGKIQLLTKDKLDRQMGWCDGREQLRKELRSKVIERLKEV
ncbi:MAG: hypothetical protein NUV73_04480 [Candidatus Daviesbacteria bacterium]|nr:hypothetical protein [Candidatus Daviesbacteria bacterium]